MSVLPPLKSVHETNNGVSDLDPTQIKNWTVNDVLLALSTSPQLQVIRSYLKQESFHDVDGETLIALTGDDLLKKGIKTYHIEKFLRYTASLKFKANNPEHSYHANPKKRRSNIHAKRAPPVGVKPPTRRPTPPANLTKSPSTQQTDEIGVNWKKGHIIGRGCYGAVYMVLNESNGCFMAMKEVELVSYGAANAADEVKALVSEIYLLQQLKHINIVRYLGSRINQQTNSIQIFTEWVPGGSIKSILNNFGPLSIKVVRSYVHQALEGLLYLHDHHIWHRDIKGANILVTEDGVIKLADFGTSEKLKKEDNGAFSATNNNTTAGTPLFMAPEAMLDPKSVDGLKADIWSIGATTLQMCTGNPPWKEHNFSNFMQLMLFVAKDDSIPKIDEQLPPALRDFIGMCFRRNPPSSRPSARQLLTHPFFGKTSNNCGRRGTPLMLKPIGDGNSGGSSSGDNGIDNSIKTASQAGVTKLTFRKSVVALPPLSVDNHQGENLEEEGYSSVSDIDDDGGGHHNYHKIQSYLEETTRESHSSFHRSSSMEDDEDTMNSLNDAADTLLMGTMFDDNGVSTVNRAISSSKKNPFSSNAECEELTSTGIQRKITEEEDTEDTR
jgi:serine/threonine protein kinase